MVRLEERVMFRTKEGEGGEGIIQIYIRKLKVMHVVSCLVSICDSWFTPFLPLLRSSLLMVGSLTAGYHLQVAHALVSDEYCTSLDEKDDLNIGAMNIYESTMYSLSRCRSSTRGISVLEKRAFIPCFGIHENIETNIEASTMLFVNLNVYFCVKVHQLEVKHS